MGKISYLEIRPIGFYGRKIVWIPIIFAPVTFQTDIFALAQGHKCNSYSWIVYLYWHRKEIYIIKFRKGGGIFVWIP